MPALAVMTLLQDPASASAISPLRARVSVETAGDVACSGDRERRSATPLDGSQPTRSASTVLSSGRRTCRPSSRPIARAVVMMVFGPCTTPLAGRRAPETCTTEPAPAAVRSARSLESEARVEGAMRRV